MRIFENKMAWAFGIWLVAIILMCYILLQPQMSVFAALLAMITYTGGLTAGYLQWG